ncbi:hypothetical protein pb186bvf_011166 [Paramecium bursaria]
MKDIVLDEEISKIRQYIEDRLKQGFLINTKMVDKQIKRVQQNMMRYFKQIHSHLLAGASLAYVGQSSFCSSKNEYYFNYGSYMIPHPDKVAKGGEDALFTHRNLISVADGVGGWADYGVDPGLYSKELCLRIKEIYLKDTQIDSKQLIIQAAKATKATGSSTVCVMKIGQTIDASFVGDSGYAIYRKKENEYELLFKSEEQQRSFNFPLQIGSEGDSPTVAKQEKHDVLSVQKIVYCFQGDLIVLGTDGLFDNIQAKQILIIINDHIKSSGLNPQALSQSIAEYAYRLSLDKNYNSPFAQNAYKHRLHFKGGKSDDITVVVAELDI